MYSVCTCTVFLQFPLSARTFSPTSATMPNGAALGTTDASSISNLTNYSQLMVDARKSASVYSLVSLYTRITFYLSGSQTLSDYLQTKSATNFGAFQAGSKQTSASDTLQPVIPPFHPPPAFDSARPKMPPSASRRSLESASAAASPDRPTGGFFKGFRSASSSGNSSATDDVIARKKLDMKSAENDRFVC